MGKVDPMYMMEDDDGDLIPNITADGTFLYDQMYYLPVNVAKDGKGSVTIVRACIPAGTGWREGYAGIREFLDTMGCPAGEVAERMEIPEIMAE